MPGDCADTGWSAQSLAAMLLALPETTSDYPFGPQAQAFRVGGKIFALVFERHGALSVNLKCEPGEAQQLRDAFACVQPGYHMNKRHWNTVVLDGSLPEGEISRQAEHAWQQVVRGLPAARRDILLAQLAP